MNAATVGHSCPSTAARWLSMLLGVAGTYRKHENVDVIYEAGGHRTVASLTPL